MDGGGLAIGIVFLCAAVGLTTCSIVERHGAWSAYTSCINRHTPAECKEVKP